MRTKYKIGQFVRFNRGGVEGAGEITGVIYRKLGTVYKVNAMTGCESTAEAEESEITAAYREITVRATKPAKSKPVKSARVNTKAGAKSQDSAPQSAF